MRASSYLKADLKKRKTGTPNHRMQGFDHFPQETQMTEVVTRVEKFIKAKLTRALLGGFLATVIFTLTGHIVFGLCMGAIIGRPAEA